MIYYIFPVVILGTGACIVALVDPAMIGEPANPLQRRWKFCQSGTLPRLPDSPGLQTFRGLSHGFCTLGATRYSVY